MPKLRRAEQDEDSASARVKKETQYLTAFLELLQNKFDSDFEQVLKFVESEVLPSVKKSTGKGFGGATKKLSKTDAESTQS